MGTILTRDWTGSDTDPWTDAGFEKIAGSAFVPEIQSGTGWGPTASGTELLYRATGFPQSTGYKVLLDATWKDAAGAGRILGILLRCQSTGQCYSLELDSNVGTTRCRIRRRSAAGSWTTVSAWASPAGIPASAALNAGVTLKAVVQNEAADEVTVSLYYGTTLLATYTDTSASRIESGGGVGIYLDANWQDDDIVVDNFLLRDFEDDWSGSDSLSEDCAISVDGTWYSWADLAAAKIRPVLPKDAIGNAGSPCTFETLDGYADTNAILYAGALVKVAIEGTVVCAGRLRDASRRANSGTQGQSWALVSLTQLAADVVLRDPDTGEDVMRWNLAEDHVEYATSRGSDVELGEAIADILDNHVDGDGNLRDQGAAPPDEDTAPYVQAELDLMTAKVEMSATGDPYSGVEELLSYTKYALRIDPDTKVWHFLDRTAGTQTDVDQSDEHVEWEEIPHFESNYTAFETIGARPETTEQTLKSDDGDLTEGWTASLEATHDSEKAWKNTDSGLVDSIGTSGGRVTMTPAAPFGMTTDEWNGCVVTFEGGNEAGNSYSVYDTGAAFVLDATAWIGGGPSATDAFTVRGDAKNGGRDNGYTEIGRRYLVDNTDLGIPEDACAYVEIIQGNAVIQTSAHVTTPDDGSGAVVTLDLPSVGLINRASGGDPADVCDEGNTQALTAASVEITVPTYDTTDPVAPRRRYPISDGDFTGTAFTKDSSKWNGGGKPGRGDPAVMRTLRLSIPSYDGSADMQTEVDTVMQDLAAVFSPAAREVQLTIKGSLDTSFAGLGKRLTVSNSGGSATGLESADDLFVYAVEWDPDARTTTIYAGTQGAGEYSPEKVRLQMLEEKAEQLAKRTSWGLDEIMACLANKTQQVSQIAPASICADQITTTNPHGGSSTMETSRMRNVECSAGAMSPPTCTTFLCVPTSASQLLANLQAMDNQTVVDQKTDDFDATVDDQGGALPGTQLTILEGVVWLMQQVQELGAWAIDISSALDQEMKKAQTDLAGVRTTFDQVIACINARLIQIDNCFTNKVDGLGSPCELDPCEHSFTETVCESPCLASDAADATTPPDCEDQGGE